MCKSKKKKPPIPKCVLSPEPSTRICLTRSNNIKAKEGKLQDWKFSLYKNEYSIVDVFAYPFMAEVIRYLVVSCKKLHVPSSDERKNFNIAAICTCTTCNCGTKEHKDVTEYLKSKNKKLKECKVSENSSSDSGSSNNPVLYSPIPKKLDESIEDKKHLLKSFKTKKRKILSRKKRNKRNWKKREKFFKLLEKVKIKGFSEYPLYELLAALRMRELKLGPLMKKMKPEPLKLFSKALKIIFLNGSKYEGYFDQMMINGFGQLRYKNSSAYKGKFKNGMAHGFGMMTWDDGSYYQGSLKKNLKHGHGSFVFFKDGRINEDTNIYKAHFGEWKNGLKHNHGLTVFGKSNWYEGNWDNGLMNGFGIRCYNKGCYYIGNWKDGRRDGFGTMMWPNRDMYQGDWVKGKMNGVGTYIWNAFQVTEWMISPFQNSYAGEWKNGLRHGKGTLYMSTGAKVIANWKKGKKHGYGEILCTNGKKIIKNKLFHYDKIVDTKEPIFEDQLQDENEKGSKEIALKYNEPDTTNETSSDELIIPEGYLPECVAINAPVYSMDFDSHIYKIFVPDVCPDIYPDGTDFSSWVSTGKRLSIYCLEREWLQKVLIKRGPELNFIYNKYATGGSSKQFQFNPALMRICLWKMLRDGGLFLTKKSLVDFDKEVGLGDKPFDQIPMYEMIHYLLILSWEVFAKQKFCNPNIPGILASAFDRFIEDVLVPVAHGYCGNILMLFRYVPLKALFSLFNSIKKPFTIGRLLKVIKPVEDSFRDILPRPSKFIRKLAKGLNVIHPNGSLDYLPIHDPYFDLVYEKKTSVIVEGSDLSLLGLLGFNIFIQVLLEVLPNIVTLEGTIREDYEITFLDFCDILSELIVIYLDKVHGDLNDEDLEVGGEEDEEERDDRDTYKGERVDEEMEDEDPCLNGHDASTDEEENEHFYDIIDDNYYDGNNEEGRHNNHKNNEEENGQKIAENKATLAARSVSEVEGEIPGYCKDRLRFKMYVKKNDDDDSKIGGCSSDVYLSGEENQLLNDLRFVDDDDEVIDDEEEEDAAYEEAFADFMACEDGKSGGYEVEESEEEEYSESEAQKECPPEHECLEPISKALPSENEVKSDIENLSEKIRDCFNKNVLESNAAHFRSFLNILLGSEENYKNYPCMAYLKKSKKLINIFNNLVKKSGLLHKKRFDFIKSRLETEFIKKFINNKLKHGSHGRKKKSESPPLQDTPSDSEISDDSSENSDTFGYNNFFHIDSDSSDDWGGWSDSSTNTDVTKKSNSSYKETEEEISSASSNTTFTTLVETDADNSNYELNYSATDEESELIRGSSTSSPITDTLTSRSDETSIGFTNLSIACSETNASDVENGSEESIRSLENSENNEHKPIIVVHETEKSREEIKRKAEILKSKIAEALFGEGNGREEYNKLLLRLGGSKLIDELRDSLKRKMGINEIIFNKEESLESESEEESDSTSEVERSKSIISKGSFLETTSGLNLSSDKNVKRTKNDEFDRYTHMFTLKNNRPLDYDYFFDLPPIKHPLIVGGGIEGCSSDDDRYDIRKHCF